MYGVLRAVLLLAVLVSCTEPRSATCREVCARESACHEEIETSDNFDEGECLDACAALERDQVQAQSVIKHAECVRAAAAAKDCKQMLACP
jgi:hypothetical protein